MRSEASVETTATEAWSWILIGIENEVRYASQSGSETTDKRRLSIDSSNLPVHLKYKSLVFSWGKNVYHSTSPNVSFTVYLFIC